jgi:hypothetical protein
MQYESAFSGEMQLLFSLLRDKVTIVAFVNFARSNRHSFWFWL